MGILNKIFKKRNQDSLEVINDDVEVILKTEKDLSEEQRNVIVNIVKNGTMSGADPSNIVVQMMMATGIFDVVILNRIKDDVSEVVIWSLKGGLLNMKIFKEVSYF